MTEPLFPDPESAARLQVENETLHAECSLLRDEATRVSALNRTLQSRLVVVEAERDRLQFYLSAIQRSGAWRVIQKLRSFVGRRW